MDIKARQSHLIEQISQIKDEETLVMLEESIAYYNHSNGRDIIDDLTPEQLKELISLLEEPSEKDTISLEEFRKNTAKWRTKS